MATMNTALAVCAILVCLTVFCCGVALIMWVIHDIRRDGK